MALLEGRALPLPGGALGRARSSKLLLAVVILLVVVVAMLQVHQLSRVAGTGYQINELNRVRSEKQAENRQLEADVAQLSSLGRVDWQARVQLHMEPPAHILYIDVNHAAPARETLPTRFISTDNVTPSAVSRDANEPFWKRVLRRFGF